MATSKKKASKKKAAKRKNPKRVAAGKKAARTRKANQRIAGFKKATSATRKKKRATKKRATKKRATRKGRAGGVARAQASAHVKSREAWRRAVRTAAGAPANTPIIVSPGASEPRLAGEGWQYKTRGGKPIHHPSAYSKKGFGNMVYHASTAHVKVGQNWSP